MDKSVAKLIEDFFSQYRVRKYPKGQVLLLNGETPEYVYNLVAGRVKQYDVTYRGDEVILNVFKPPAFFSMSIVINNTSNPFIYEAETEVELRQAPAADVVKFLREHPTVTFDLLSRVYRGLDGLLDRIVHLMTGSAKSRLMFEVLVACRRFGNIQPDNSVSIKISETDLAARAGLSRETVSREMKKLEDSGLVSLKSGTLMVKDITVFEKKVNRTV